MEHVVAIAQSPLRLPDADDEQAGLVFFPTTNISEMGNPENEMAKTDLDLLFCHYFVIHYQV